MAEPYYLTTAIHYPNGKPHIGHAYETIAADVVARFQRLRGREVRFQTGTDEHGLKMAQKARDLGKTPRELADEMSGHFKDLFDALNISYDRFIRTTDADHHRASQAIWQAMEAKGDLYLDRLRRLVLGSRRSLLRRERTGRRRGGRKAVPAGDSGRMDRGGNLVLPPVSLCRAAARTAEHTGLSRTRKPSQ